MNIFVMLPCLHFSAMAQSYFSLKKVHVRTCSVLTVSTLRAKRYAMMYAYLPTGFVIEKHACKEVMKEINAFHVLALSLICAFDFILNRDMLRFW